MASKSKAKGSNFESQVAKLFSEWYGQAFNRTPASGALRWGNGKWTYGDLVPPASFPFLIECKANELVTLEALLQSDNSTLEWFWNKQAVGDAKRASEEMHIPIVPLLVYKRNHRGRTLLMEDWLARELDQIYFLRILWFTTVGFAAVDLTKFFETVRPESLDNLYKERFHVQS